MEDPRSRPDARKEAEIAAAEWLLEEAPAPAPVRSPSPVIAPGSGEGFELADAPEQEEKAAEPDPIDVPKRPARPRAESGGVAGARHADVSRRPRPGLEAGPLVEQVWSRTSEWGPTLVVLFGWAALVIGVLYLTISWELYEL